MAFQRTTSLATAVNLTTTSAPPSRTTGIRLQPETQNVRLRVDGVAPTATVGWLLTAGQIYEFTGNLESVQVIETAASASLNWDWVR